MQSALRATACLPNNTFNYVMKIVKTDKYQNPKTDSCLFWIQTNVCQQEKLVG